MLDKANEIKRRAKEVLAVGSQAEKMLLRAKAPHIAKALRRAANVRAKLREIVRRAHQGDLAARKTASIFSHVMAHRDRVQAYVGRNEAQAWTPGILVTQHGEIVPGKWLHAQSAAAASRLSGAPMLALPPIPKKARRP